MCEQHWLLLVIELVFFVCENGLKSALTDLQLAEVPLHSLSFARDRAQALMKIRPDISQRRSP